MSGHLATLRPELHAYAQQLQAAGFTVYAPPMADKYRNPGHQLSFFHYSREVDGRECFGTYSLNTGPLETGGSHTMPLIPSRLNGSGAIVGAQWGDEPALGLDSLDPESVAYAEIVARPSNWCPFNAEPTQAAQQRANAGVPVPKSYYQGARLANGRPWGIGTHYEAAEVFA